MPTERLTLLLLVAIAVVAATRVLVAARRRADAARRRDRLIGELWALARAEGDPRLLFRQAAAGVATLLRAAAVSVWETGDDGDLRPGATLAWRSGICEVVAPPAPDLRAPADGSGLGRGRLVVPFGDVDAPAGAIVVTTAPRAAGPDDRALMRAVGDVLAAALALRRARRDARRLVAAEAAARIAAERASRTCRDAVAIVCHELRTPLQPLVAWSRILRDAPTNPATVARALAAIEHSTTLLRRLAEDLIEQSRGDGGSLRLERARIDLAGPVLAALELMRAPAEAKDVRVEPWIDPGPLPVLGDAQRLEQVAWNLIGNAVKFTPKGGRVSVAVRRAGAVAEIAVRDTGAGIPGDALAHVFEPFWRAGGTAEGVGLGLAIVHDIVDRHGGAVHVMSAGRDLGATFVVSLPLAAEVVTPLAAGGGLR